MSVVLRLGLFVAALAVVFVAAVGVGRATGPVGPVGPAPTPTETHPTHEGTGHVDD